MLRKHKTLAANLGLVLASLLFAALLLEFGVFRLLLRASDLPRTSEQNGVVRRVPGVTGLYRVRDEIAARFRINAQGWNSGHDAYAREKTPGMTRVAVIGDSYVEALQVDHDRSFCELLEQRLGSGVEVYRFGIGGAPLSQYLYMLRNEVLAYAPDVVVLNLVHNDFAESYGFKPGAYTSAFFKLDVRDGVVRGEIPPAPWAPSWYEPLRESATWRYLSVRRGFSFSLLRKAVLGDEEQQNGYQANVSLQEIGARELDPNLVAVARALLASFRDLSLKHGFQPVLVMDGVRVIIEAESTHVLDYDTGALRLNKLVRSLGAEMDLPFLDLHPVFFGEYVRHPRPFSHAHDAHWNADAHAVVAEALAEFLLQQRLLP